MKFVLDYDHCIFQIFASSGDLAYECTDPEQIFAFCSYIVSDVKSAMRGADDND